jgi:hypothetical protein
MWRYVLKNVSGRSNDIAQHAARAKENKDLRGFETAIFS